MTDTNPFAQFVQQPSQPSQANPFAQWAVVPDDVVAAAGQNATRQQLSDAFYRAKQTGDEQTAMHIIGQIQRQGLALAPMNAEQSEAAFQKANDVNVAAMPWYDRAWTGVGEGANSVVQGVKQAYDRVADIVDPRAPTMSDLVTGQPTQSRVQQDEQQIANNRQLSQALNRTGWGEAGNIAGSLAESSPLLLIPGVGEAGEAGIAGRLALGAVGGAANGYISPYATGGEHVANTMLGALSAPAGLGLAKAGQLVGRGSKAIIQRFLNPGAVADRKLARAIGTDATAQLGAARGVPGEQISVANALQTPKAVQFERAVRNDPEGAPIMAAADNASNAARMALLKRHLGMDQVASTPSGAPIDAMQAADMTRKTNLRNFIDANMGPERLVHTGDIADALAPLTSSSNPTVKSAARQILSDMQEKAASDGSGEFLHPMAMDDIRQNIGNVVRQASNNAGSGKQGAAQATALLGPVQQKIVDAIDAVSPGYRQAVQNYAEQSVPVNTAQAIRNFLNPDTVRSLNSSGDRQATATAVANFLGKAKKRPFGISPEAEQDVRDIHQSLLNRSVADNKMGASGSNTAADIQNHIGRQLARHGSYMVAGGLAGLPFGGPIGSVVGGLAGLAGGAGVEWANRRVAREVAERAADSSMAMNALGRVLGANNRRAAVNQKMIPFFNNLGTMNPAFIRAYMATQGDSTQPDYAH